jgi:hypothetical protein
MSNETSPAALFHEPPVIRFVPVADTCPCGQSLVVQKTRRKTVLSMTGPFVAHETLVQCPQCRTILGCDQLQRIVPSRCNTAYDVMVFIGRALFQRFRTVHEILGELAERNVFVSASEVYYLGRKFIILLARAHRLATPRIRQQMAFSGGYILHIDATHEGDAPLLMTGLDSLSEIVLSNIKVPSENTENTKIFLEKVKKQYGIPTACVHDMGGGICRAVAEVFPGIRDYICHFHFLRDIGKDYLDPAYRVLRKCLQSYGTSTKLHTIAREARKELGEQAHEPAIPADPMKGEDLLNRRLAPHACVYVTVMWIIRGKNCGHGFGFPFDRPLFDFANRIMTVVAMMPRMRRLYDPDNSALFASLIKQFSKIKNDQRISDVLQELRWRSCIFDQLRQAMRIALPNGQKGLNDDGDLSAMASIREGVAEFRRQIEKNAFLAADSLTGKMLVQLDKYDDKLFADPIEVDTPAGRIPIAPQRTNNILERFFRSMRRGHRRRTGNNTIRRFLQAMLADTPLVKNLDNPAYMKILLNSKKNLEELFAEINSAPTASDVEEIEDPGERLLPGYRNLIKLPDLPSRLVSSALKTARAKSN